MSKVENIYEHPDYLSLEDFEGEVWRHIPGASPQYFISSLGRIKNIGKTKATGTGNGAWPPRILKVYSLRGYYMVSVKITSKCTYIHRAVALAFIGEKPTDDHQVNHKNGIKSDNTVDNLEWVTHFENMRHAWETGLIDRSKYKNNGYNCRNGKKHGCPVAQYTKNGEYVASYPSILDAGRAMGTGPCCIKRVLSGKFRSAHGFRWERITREEFNLLQKQATEQ